MLLKTTTNIHIYFLIAKDWSIITCSWNEKGAHIACAPLFRIFTEACAPLFRIFTEIRLVIV